MIDAPVMTPLMAMDTAREPATSGRADARRVAEEFESFFIARFIDAMQSGLETDGPFGGGHGEAMFRGMLSDEYAKAITGSGGLGLADSVYREILKLQEVENDENG